MKKLKKSMLAIIIGVCTVVVVLSTVLAVVLLRKDGDNPPPKNTAKDAEYQLTPAQLDLVNAINAKNKADAEADRKELSVFDESKFVDENGQPVNFENVEEITDEGFMLYDDDGDPIDRYLFGDNGKSIKLSSLLKDTDKREYAFHDSHKNYYAYSYSLIDGSGEYGLSLFVLNNGECSLIFEKTSLDVNAVEKNNIKMQFTFTDDVWVFMAGFPDSSDNKICVYFEIYPANEQVVDDCDLIYSFSGKIVEKDSSFSFTSSERALYFKNNNSINFFNKNGEFHFIASEEFTYEYKILDNSFLIIENNEIEQIIKYKLVDGKTLTLKDIIVDNNEKEYEVKVISEDYFSIYEKSNDETDFGKMTYYDYAGNIIISYLNATSDDTIKLSDGKRIVLYNKIIATKNCVEAVDYKILSSNENYYIYEPSNLFNDSGFIVSGQGYNFMSYKGELLYDEDFDKIYLYDENYIGVIDEEYYLLNPSLKTKEEIVDFDETKSLVYVDDYDTLLDYGYYVTDDGSNLSVHQYDGSIVEINIGKNLLKLDLLSNIYQNIDTICGIGISKSGQNFILSNNIKYVEQIYSAPTVDPYAYGEVKSPTHWIIYSDDYKYFKDVTFECQADCDDFWWECWHQAEATMHIDFSGERRSSDEKLKLTINDDGRKLSATYKIYLTGYYRINYSCSVSSMQKKPGKKYISKGLNFYSHRVENSTEIPYDVVYYEWRSAKDLNDTVSSYSRDFATTYSSQDTADYNGNYSSLYTDKDGRYNSIYRRYYSSSDSHVVDIDDPNDILGATFYGWSSIKDVRVGTSAVETSIATYYNSKNYYATKKAYEVDTYNLGNYGFNYFCYAIYKPNFYTIELDAYGNLPRNGDDTTLYKFDDNIGWNNGCNSNFTMTETEKELLFTYKDILYYNYNSKKWLEDEQTSYGGTSTYQVTLPTPTVFGYKFVGWGLETGGRTKSTFIQNTFCAKDDSGKVIEFSPSPQVTSVGSGSPYIPGETLVYALNYGCEKKYDTIGSSGYTDDKAVYYTQGSVKVCFTALWEPVDFTVTFDYGNVQDASNFNAYVQLPVTVQKHVNQSKCGAEYYFDVTVDSSVYTSCTTCNKNTTNTISVETKGFGSNSYVALKLSSDTSHQYILYDKDMLPVNMVNDVPSVEHGREYFIIYQANINESQELFNIYVHGNSLENTKNDDTYNIVYGAKPVPSETHYLVNASMKFDANVKMSTLFKGDSDLFNSKQKELLDPQYTTVAGSASKLLGWLVQFDVAEESVGNLSYFLQYSIIDNLAGYNSLVQYMQMLNEDKEEGFSSAASTSSLTVYALYSTKPYKITTEYEIEHSSTSIEDGEYYSKDESSIKNSNQETISINNNTLVGSNTRFEMTPSSNEYLGSVILNIDVYNDYISPDTETGNVAQDADKLYYIFDKIELSNFGVKIWNSSTSKYTYYNATVVLEWNGSAWIVYANIPGKGRVDASNNQDYYSYDGAYAFGKYNTVAPSGGVADSANKYNRITLVSGTSTSIEIHIDYLGISGDYILDGKLTHSATSGGTFAINETTAEGGYFGFTAKAYVKSNMTADDDFAIIDQNNTSDEDYIITTASTNVYKIEGKNHFWINNVEYVLSSDSKGFYQLATNGSECTIAGGSSFLDASGNIRNAVVYFDENMVHYPKQYATHTDTTKFVDVYDKEMLTNFSNTLLYAIRPEQHYVYSSLNPTNMTELSPDETRRYELNSYLKQITIGGTSYSLDINRTIENSGLDYVYSRLYIVSENRFDPYGSNVKLISSCNKTISYLGNNYIIHDAWYLSGYHNNSTGKLEENITPEFKNRSFVLYLTTHEKTGEFMYFMYTDIYTAGANPTAANEFAGTNKITFVFAEFKNDLSLHINDTTAPDGVDANEYQVDLNDKYNSSDKPLVYRYYHASAGVVNNYNSTGLRQNNSSSISNVAFAGLTDSATNKYMTSQNRSWKINPEEFIIFELQPTSGYLINNLIIKLKGQVIVNLKLDSIDDLDRAEGFYTYTHDTNSLGNRTAIRYSAPSTSKYFNVYNFNAGGGTERRTGIGYSFAKDANWVTNYGNAYFNPIWIMVSGAYDEVEIYATTISYTEFYINDDANNNLGFTGEVSDGFVVDKNGDGFILDELSKLSLVVGSLDSGVKLGTTNEAYDATYIRKIDTSYRIVFFGKAQIFNSGVHIFASGEDYSAYFTSAQRYLDKNYSTGANIQTAFEGIATQTGSVYFGRNNSNDETLYWNTAGGYNTVLQTSAGDYWKKIPTFTNRNLTSNDKLVYFFIPNFKNYHGERFDVINNQSIGKIEYANKYLIVLGIKKNTVEVSTNSYIYNQTLTTNEQNPIRDLASSNKLPYMFNENSFTSTLQYYKDTANNRNWIKENNNYYCYQLDYVGTLGGSDYKKQYSWFNDTILTNIETKYHNSASNESVDYNQNTTTALTAKTMSGYGLSFKYYEIPGYYLQYIEIITRDYGSIYIPISTIVNTMKSSSDYNLENKIYRADTASIISGLYYEIDYVTSSSDAYFEIRFYQDDSDILAGAKSLNLISNNMIVNFYSYPQTYTMNLYSYDNTGEGKNVNALPSSLKVSTTDTISRNGNYFQEIMYDSLTVIGATLSMQGYTFVGWASYNIYEYNNALESYEVIDRFSNDTVTGNSWNSASLWYDVRTLFDRSNRSKMLEYKTRSFFAYDFYVKSATYPNTTGYFITDTGYGGDGINQESYNFWSVYAQMFLSNIGRYNAAINSDFSIDLYAIWKPNTYMLQFDVDDSTPAEIEDRNGTTQASLKINNLSEGRNGLFGKYALDTANYLYYSLEGNTTETYYCYVTFDSTNWYIKKAKNGTNLIINDLYNSYYTASQSFVSVLGDGSNELNMVIDRYGYTWLGWFAGKQTNVLQGASAVYDQSNLVFGSNYYYNATVPLSNRIANNYTYYQSEGNTLAVNGQPMFNKSLYGMLYGNKCIDEIRSEFVYWGEHKVVKSLIPETGNERYYVAHYSYYGNGSKKENGGISAGVDFHNLKMYKNGDYLNIFTGTSSREYTYNSETSKIAAAITYFDTTMAHEKLLFDGYTVRFTRDVNNADSKVNRILHLTAYWQQNLYEIVVDWQDNTPDDTLNQYGSSEAGILQTDGTVLKENFGSAHFDEFELSQRLNTFTPVRVGYDFIGWSYYYDTTEGAINSPSFFNIPGVEIDYQNYLNLSALTAKSGTNDALYSEGTLLSSYSAKKEVLGDNDGGHYVYIFALWKPQTFTINIDLNIEWEDLENLYDKDSNFVVALYNNAKGRDNDGNLITSQIDYKDAYDFSGIRSDFYKLNENYYTEIVANINFVITFDELFETAYCEVSGERFYLVDLFATSAGYYFLGWLYNADDPNAVMVANSLSSMVSNVSNKANSVNADGNVHIGVTEYAVPRFDFAFYTELYNTNYKNRTQNEQGQFVNGENIVYFKNAEAGENHNKLSVVDKHGASSNFGFVTMAGKNYPIVSEVVQTVNGALTVTNYYLYFKYLGVKYYVVYYYEKENNVKTPLLNDQTYLYYKRDDNVKYIVRFDTDGRPYFVSTDYNNRKIFASGGEFGNIRIAVFKKASETANLTGSNNLLSANDKDGISYIFKYISNVVRHENGDYQEFISSVQLSFTPKTTRQFTMYAHWQHKNDFEINIVNGNNNGGTSNSNEGLAGLYDIENVVDGHNEGKDEDGDLNAYQHHITEHYGDKVETAVSETYPYSDVIDEINEKNVGYLDEKLSLTYNYYDDLNFNIVPFYNGRYLSEMTIKFYSVTEQQFSQSDDNYEMKSRFVYTTYTMVVKFAWNSAKNMIEVKNITFNVGSSPTTINCGMQTPADEGEYSRIYGLTLSSNPISQLSILDKTSFASYFMKLYEYSTGEATGAVAVANNDKDATYGRNDVNKISFNMVDVMSSIDITCRFSVQTYSVELYHFLDDNDKRGFTLQSGNRYKVDISTGEFDSIVELSNKEGQEAFVAGQIATDMKLATISTDCGASTPANTYKVPYGYYIYGMYFTSSFWPHRPVDTNSYPKIGTDDTPVYETASGIIKNPLYGFEWIYANGYYTYGSTTNQLIKDGTDMAYAQSSPILGSKNKFAESVRLDNLTSYAFVGWYEYEISGSDIYFNQYNQNLEASYINRDIKLYGYYRPVNAPTSIVFYTWDDATKGYKVYDGNKQEYTLNAELVFNPYQSDETTQKVSANEQMSDFVDEFGNVKINAFNNYGVNERKFNNQSLFDGGDFENDNKEDNYSEDEDMLDKVLKTYWFYDYYYNILQFTETTNIEGQDITKTYTLKFDIAKYLNSKQSSFYYLQDESKTDEIVTYPGGSTNETEVMANRVYVELFGSNESGYYIMRDDTEIELDVVEISKYDFDGAYLYLKLPEFGDALITQFEQAGITGIPNAERYYKLHEITSISDYINSLIGTKFEITSENVSSSWIFKAEPRYWTEIKGVRYYILPRNDTYASGNGAKTIFDKDGRTTVSSYENPTDITSEIRNNSEIVVINNYYIDYFETYYQVNYKTYTDAYIAEDNSVCSGSEFINPYYNIETNTVSLPAEGDYPARDYYFDVSSATLYYNGAPESTTPHYVYSPVNQNYDVNVSYVTESGASHWEYTGVTIKKLPSPNIGYWYDGGEKYGFVGYIALTKQDIDDMSVKGSDGDDGENSSGEIYESFMRYIDAVYTADKYDDVNDFGVGEEAETRMQAFIDKYDSAGSALDPLETRLARAHSVFVSRLKLSVGGKVGEYSMKDFLSNLLLAEEYLPEKEGETTAQYVHINVPVTFTNLEYIIDEHTTEEIVDPRTGKSITMSISFLKQFSLITQNTVISKDLHAIPIYSPFIMEYTEQSVTNSGSVVGVNVEKMHVWHFDVSGNSTTHVYRKKYGDYVNFAVLTYDQYIELKANKTNLADYFTKMIKNNKIKANFIENSSGDIQIDFGEGYQTGDYVVVAYYNKTGLAGNNTYVVRVSDNLLHISIGGAGDLAYEITTMDKYGTVTTGS